jgi:hypothetical protein
MTGTLQQLAAAMVQSFQELSRAQQKQTRKEIYEETTGKPFRPN